MLLQESEQKELAAKRAKAMTEEELEAVQSVDEEEILTPLEWLRKMIQEALAPVSAAVGIREFREKRVHNDTRVCSLMIKNYSSLMKLYTHHLQQYLGAGDVQMRAFTLASATTMLRKASLRKAQIADIDVVRHFSFSKMSVVDELADRKSYFSLEFVEFMEFICRVACAVQKPPPESKTILPSLESLLTLLFRTIDCKVIAHDQIQLESQYLSHLTGQTASDESDSLELSKAP